MDTLPDGVLLEIMSFLDHHSLVRFGSTTHRHLALSSQECMWKRLCSRIWLLDRKPVDRSDQTWRQMFCAFYRQFGKYAAFYADMKHTWTQMQLVLQEKLPNHDIFTDARCSEEELDAFQRRKILRPIPEQVRCSYRMVNGQNLEAAGLFGTSIESRFSAIW